MSVDKISNMTLPQYRETNWRCWAVKGRLCPIHWSEKALWTIYYDYGKRMWENEEATYTAPEGFREEFNKRIIDNVILHSYVNSPNTPLTRFFNSLQQGRDSDD